MGRLALLVQSAAHPALLPLSPHVVPNLLDVFYPKIIISEFLVQLVNLLLEYVQGNFLHYYVMSSIVCIHNSPSDFS